MRKFKLSHISGMVPRRTCVSETLRVSFITCIYVYHVTLFSYSQLLTVPDLKKRYDTCFMYTDGDRYMCTYAYRF